MFIKKQVFKDIDTLIEQLFDFGLGNPSPTLQELINQLSQQLNSDVNFQSLKSSIIDEEEAMELEDDTHREMLAKILIDRFDEFAVEHNKLYGLSEGKKELLYTLDF